MAYRGSDVKKPSEWLDDLLRGKIVMADAPEAIRSWARLPIHQAAQEILSAPDIGARRNMLGKIPAPIRPYVEAEIKRLWQSRKR